MSLVFVDCEAWGGCPATGQLTEFGAVMYENMKTYHGVIVKTEPDPDNPAVPKRTEKPDFETEVKIATEFERWLVTNGKSPFVFVSDNNGFDWQWINDLFWRTLGHNPFGHSSRRIGDFAAGLRGDFWSASKWKRLRITKHDHNPVHDSLGNVEAFRRLLKGER